MSQAINTLFVALSGPFGWAASAVVLVGTVLLVIAMARSAALRSWKWRGLALVTGLAGAGVLLVPFALNASRVPSPPGPETVQRASIQLPVPGEDGRMIGMDLWFPAHGAAVTGEELAGCAGVPGLPLAVNEGEAVPLLLYMPHFRGERNDSPSRFAALASQGYVVVTFDDIAHDPPDPAASAPEEAARQHEWPYGAEAEYDRTVALNAIRAELGARKALAVLDSLSACAASAPQSPWSMAVDYARVGHIGYSFGGASAAEAALLDPRIAAVASLDGSLYGRAASELFAAPYLYLRRGEPLPTQGDLTTGPMQERMDARFFVRDLGQQVTLAARPGSGAYRIAGTDHGSFSEALLTPSASSQWLLNDPVASFDAINAYLLDFFDMHLRGTEPRLIGQPTADRPNVASLAELGLVPGADFGLPADPGMADQD